jgi:hypothetical protein
MLRAEKGGMRRDVITARSGGGRKRKSEEQQTGIPCRDMQDCGAGLER